MSGQTTIMSILMSPFLSKQPCGEKDAKSTGPHPHTHRCLASRNDTTTGDLNVGRQTGSGRNGDDGGSVARFFGCVFGKRMWKVN